MFKSYIFPLIVIFLSSKSFANIKYISPEIKAQSDDEMMGVLSLLEPIKLSKHQLTRITKATRDSENSNKALLSLLHVYNKEYSGVTQDFERLKSRIVAEKNNENLSAAPDFLAEKMTLNRRSSEFDSIIVNAAQKYQLDSALIKAVVFIESSFNPYARSSVGAQGLMQLMPATAKRFNVKNSFDAHQNIHGGTQYLSWLLKKFNGNLTYALAAYNAGEGNVQKYGGVPPFKETQLYVVKVLGMYEQFR